MLGELERDPEPRSGVGEVALSVGPEPDEKLRDHAEERRFFRGEAAGRIGDRDSRLLVAGVRGGEAGDVQQLEGALAVARRDLSRRL